MRLLFRTVGMMGGMTFSIQLVPLELGPDYERLGVITIGDFTERFACRPVFVRSSLAQVERQWRTELKSLLAGEPAVVLAHDPRFAWVFYRDGQVCHIQQRFFLDGVPVGSNLHTDRDRVPPRCVVTDDGERVSEWSTSMEAIEQFLNSI